MFKAFKLILRNILFPGFSSFIILWVGFWIYAQNLGDNIHKSSSFSSFDVQNTLNKTTFLLPMDAFPVVNHDVGFTSSDFVMLSWEFDSSFASQQANIIWTSRNNPNITHRRNLNIIERVFGSTILADDPDWSGLITQLGIELILPSNNTVTLKDMTLCPRGPSLIDSLRIFGEYWNSHELWGPDSMNYYKGPTPHVIFSPTNIIFFWIFISLIILFLLQRHKISKYDFWNYILAFIVIGWFVLDLRWQLELGTRLTDTHSQFSELDGHQKATRLDFSIFQSSQKLLLELPKNPVRLFIITKDNTNISENYFSRRLMYYLLPHRASVSSPRILKTAILDNNDFILFLTGVNVVDSIKIAKNSLNDNSNIIWSLSKNIPAVGALYHISKDD